MRSHSTGLRLWGIAELPFWPARKRLLELTDLRVLEVANLRGEALEGAARDGDRGHHRGVPVALDDLGADRIGMQAESGENLRLEIRGEQAVRADGTGDLAGRHVIEGPRQALAIAGEFERPAGELQPERDGLRVDRVGPAHHHGAGLCPGLRHERSEKRVGVGDEQVARGSELERQARVENVAAGQAEVEEPALRADRLGDLAHEGNHVVLRGPLDLSDPVHVDPGAPRDHGLGPGRQHATRDLGLRHRELHPEHGGKARRLGPDRAHLGAGVAADHRSAASGRSSSTTVWVRSGPTDTRVIGTPARATSAATYERALGGDHRACETAWISSDQPGNVS